METAKFDGLSDVDDFIMQYRILTTIKKYNDEQAKVAIAAHLSGPALLFFKANYTTFQSLDDVIEKLRHEFPSRINYAQTFYYRRQDPQESPIQYFYALDTIASKAGTIEESAFVIHYIKSLQQQLKPYFAAANIQTKQSLKAAILSYMDIFTCEQVSTVNIPLTEPTAPATQCQHSWMTSAPSQQTVASPQISTPVSSADNNQPYLKVNTQKTLYNVGEKKAIYCEGQGLDGDIEWYSPRGEKIPPRSTEVKRLFVEKRPRAAAGPTFLPLIIHNVELTDTGTYTCMAGDLKATIDIFVGEKVVMNVMEEEYSADEEGVVNLTCHVKGTPLPEVQWYKDSQIIENSDKYRITYKNRSSTSILRINNLDYFDPGTYTCKATQEKFSHFAEKICHLTVKHKPVITNEYSESEMYAILGEWKNITCKAIAYPLPNFTWSKHDGSYDQEMSEDEEEYKIITSKETGTSSVLMLHITNETLGTQYKCTVANPKGRKNFVFHVSLGNKPDPPTAVTKVAATASNITFEVACANCIFLKEEGLAPKPENLTVLGFVFELVPYVDGYAVPYWINGTSYNFDISGANDTTFTIEGLDKSTKYYVRVATRNLAGLSDWFNLEGLPETTDAAAALTKSLALLVFAIIASFCY